jgi:hypothetical protein
VRTGAGGASAGPTEPLFFRRGAPINREKRPVFFGFFDPSAAAPKKKKKKKKRSGRQKYKILQRSTKISGGMNGSVGGNGDGPSRRRADDQVRHQPKMKPL